VPDDRRIIGCRDAFGRRAMVVVIVTPDGFLLISPPGEVAILTEETCAAVALAMLDVCGRRGPARTMPGRPAERTPVDEHDDDSAMTP